MGISIDNASRREFIRLTATAAAGLVAGGLNLAARGNRVLNVAVVGTGDRGTGIITLINEIDGMTVTACCDILPFRLAHAVGLCGAKGYDRYKDMLAHPDLDAVVIATPFGLHDEMCLLAMDAGLHIYCEKTMCKGIAEIQAVLDANRGSDRVFQTGHQYNSAELYQKVTEIIRDGYVGEVTGFTCQWNRNGDWRRPVPDPQYERIINWRMYREHSGGLTAELCSHQIDFINRVLDSHPEKIAGFGGIDHWKDGRETFDNVHLLFEYPDGVDASFTCTTTNGYDDYKIKVLGSRGTIILDYASALIYLEDRAKETGMVDGVSGATIKAWENGEGAPVEASNEDSTLQALVQFYHSVTEGAPVLADIRSGAITAKCVQMSLEVLYEEKIARWGDYAELQF